MVTVRRTVVNSLIVMRGHGELPVHFLGGNALHVLYAPDVEDANACGFGDPVPSPKLT